MADVEMSDAPAKTAKVGTDSAVDGKKRFEVKKVAKPQHVQESEWETDNLEVECSGTLGLGYCSRQLCYLPQPHHGSVYV